MTEGSYGVRYWSLSPPVDASLTNIIPSNTVPKIMCKYSFNFLASFIIKFVNSFYQLFPLSVFSPVVDGVAEQRLLSWSPAMPDDLSIHQHFTSSFCTKIVLPKNYKAKLWEENCFEKYFHTRKLLVKCWWNWNLDGRVCRVVERHQRRHRRNLNNDLIDDLKNEECMFW